MSDFYPGFIVGLTRAAGGAYVGDRPLGKGFDNFCEGNSFVVAATSRASVLFAIFKLTAVMMASSGRAPIIKTGVNMRLVNLIQVFVYEKTVQEGILVIHPMNIKPILAV